MTYMARGRPANGSVAQGPAAQWEQGAAARRPMGGALATAGDGWAATGPRGVREAVA